MTDRARPAASPPVAPTPAVAFRPPPPPHAPKFRERLAGLSPRADVAPARGALPHGALPRLASAELAPRRVALGASPHAPPVAERPVARDDLRSVERALVPEPELLPFRPPPSILTPPPGARVVEAPVLDPALFSAELVESLRLGRFGRDGHAMTLRVRGARGPIDVDLREDEGRLSLRLGGDVPEGFAERVVADLEARGIAIDLEG